MDFKELRLDLCGTDWGPITGCHEHGNGP
jgi:hypothetical protein